MKYGKLTIKTSDRGQGRLSGIFFGNFKLIPRLVLVFLLWSLSMYLFALCELFYISIVFRFDGFRFHPFLERITGSRFKTIEWKMHFNKIYMMKLKL